MSVSVGVANSPTDAVTSAGALLELAAQRMRMAMDAGGNRLVGTTNKVKVDAPPPKLSHAIELLQSGHAAAVRPHMAALTQQMMPLLRL